MLHINELTGVMFPLNDHPDFSIVGEFFLFAAQVAICTGAILRHRKAHSMICCVPFAGESIYGTSDMNERMNAEETRILLGVGLRRECEGS